MTTARSSGKSSGFTLIELLIVIAIIAVLASLLLPSLVGAKVAAYNTVCRNNLRQLAIAVSLYVTDHGHYPKHAFFPSAVSESGFQVALFQDPVRWSDAIYPYTSFRWTGELYNCPGYTGTTWFDPHSPSTAYGSYGYNSFGTAGNGLDLPSGGWLKESEVTQPADMIEMGDAHISIYRHIIPNPTVVGLNSIRFNFPEPDASEDGRLKKKAMTARHRGKVNMVFADAHVEHGRTEMFHWSPHLAKRWKHDNQPD